MLQPQPEPQLPEVARVPGQPERPTTLQGLPGDLHTQARLLRRRPAGVSSFHRGPLARGLRMRRCGDSYRTECLKHTVASWQPFEDVVPRHREGGVSTGTKTSPSAFAGLARSPLKAEKLVMRQYFYTFFSSPIGLLFLCHVTFPNTAYETAHRCVVSPLLSLSVAVFVKQSTSLAISAGTLVNVFGEVHFRLKYREWYGRGFDGVVIQKTKHLLS